MSDYGYRPAPPPEDGRPQGRGGRPDGRASYGNGGGSGDRQGDYGWGGQQQGGQGHQGQAPRPRQQPYGTPASGSAAVGRGAVPPPGRGSASVGGRPTGSASVGSASVGGSAPVGGGQGRSGRASVGSASVGSASVGSASVGSASVGSASVRPVSPGAPGERTGRASVTGTRRAGPKNKSDLDGEGGKKKRKRIGRKMLAAMIAMGVIGIASITVVGVYYFQDTPPLTGLARDGESSNFYLADGETQVGAYGDTLRMQAKEEDIPETVTDALVALEDRKFWEHGGVNYVRTAGALINNLTGGETQGASTITQQYAGIYLDARDEITYDRKAREAALAIQMENKYTKKEIITAYLNAAYFGRGAYGIEAAAKNYFDVPLKELTYDQAAFIVMQVKSPNGYYDPYFGPENGDVYDEEASKDRWNFTMNALVETGQIKQADRDKLEYPTPVPTFKAGSWGGNTPLGFLINEQDGYVFAELRDRYGITPEMLGGELEGENKGGGYKVELTIDADIQNALVSTGSRGGIKKKQNENGEWVDAEGKVVATEAEAAPLETDEGYAQFKNDNPDAALEDYKDYMMTAMVAIDPATGAVVGYYGGDDGFGVDKAGAESPHPPSSTMKMITAATALENGDSVESWFNAGSPRPFDSLKLDDVEQCIGSGTYPNCTLRNGGQTDAKLELDLAESVRKSKNTPMYAIAEEYGADEILQNAAKMGLTQMSQTRSIQDDNGESHDVLINYSIAPDLTYTMHGRAVDSNGDPVVKKSTGDWDDWALVEVDGDCQPSVNLDGELIADADGEPNPCEIGKNGETDPFYYQLSFGQYPTSVRDMAAMYATIANNGYYHETHYIKDVYDNNGTKLEPKRDLNEGQFIKEDTAKDLQWIGSKIVGESTVGEELDRDIFGKTGTWEAAGEDEDGNEYPSGWNAHAWYVGAIKQLAVATWVGNVTSESDPIAGPDGSFDGVVGGTTAYPVWLEAMHRVIDAKEGDDYWDPVKWDEAPKAGQDNTWDLDNAGFNPDGAYCAANPEDTKCGASEEEDKKECEDGGGTWDGEKCEAVPDEEVTPTGDPTSEPTDGESTGEECGGIMQPPCDDPSTDPTEEEGSSDPGQGGGGGGD